MKDFCCFEYTKMHSYFTYVPNAFQTRFDSISNAISNKGDFRYLSIILSTLLLNGQGWLNLGKRTNQCA